MPSDFIQTKFDVRIGRLTYGYDIFKDEKKEFGILAGMHVTSAEVNFTFSGDFTIDGIGSVSGTVETEVAGIKGTLTEANATLHYQFGKNVGIGTGLKFYRFRVEDTDFSDKDSRFDYDFFGPVIYGSLSF